MADFIDVVKGLRDNKAAANDGFDRLESALFGKVSKSAKEEIEKQKTIKSEKEMGYFASIASGIIKSNKLLKDGFKSMLSSKSGMLGGILALLISPITILGAFLKEMVNSIKILTKLYGKGLVLVFKPFTLFFDMMVKLGKMLGQIKFLGIGTKLTAAFALLMKLNFPFAKQLKDFGIKTFQLAKKNLFTPIANGIKGIQNFFGDFAKNMYKLVGLGVDGKPVVTSNKGSKLLGAGIKAIRGLFTILGNIFKPIVDAVKVIVKSFKGLGTVLKGTGPGGGLVNAFKAIRGFFSAIGTVLAKIFIPITIIMSLFDFVTGFIEGYKKDGIMGGFKVGITKLFNGLVSAPLDLLKDLLSWALGKLGFKNASETLDSFSFKEFFTKIISSIFDGIDGAVDFIKNLFTFPKDGGILATIGKIVDIIFAPLGVIITFIRGLFGFDVGKDGKKLPPFSLVKFLGGAIEKLSNYIMEFFSSLLGGVKSFIREKLPKSVGDAILGEQPIAQVDSSKAVDDFSGVKNSIKPDRKFNLDNFAIGSIGDENARFRTLGGGTKGAFDKLLKESLGRKNLDSKFMMVDDITRALTENALDKSGSGKGGSTTIIDSSKIIPTQVNNNNSKTVISSMVQQDQTIKFGQGNYGMM